MPLLFGLGYTVSRAAGLVVKLFGGDEDAQRAARVITARFAVYVDPLGAGASVLQDSLEVAGKEGSETCRMIAQGMSVAASIDRWLPSDPPLDGCADGSDSQ
jgi:hypothetical protein